MEEKYDMAASWLRVLARAVEHAADGLEADAREIRNANKPTLQSLRARQDYYDHRNAS